MRTSRHIICSVLVSAFPKKDNDDYSIDVSNSLKQEVESEGDKKILISSETFHSHVTDKKLANLKQAFAGVAVKVILYVRRQDEWIDSAYRQFSQMDNVYPVEQIIEKAIKNRAIDYKWQVEIWEKYFGPGNVIPRVYESGQLKRDTVRDFAELIGLKMNAEMSRFDSASNPSITPAEAEILRILNCVSADTKTRDAVLDAFRADTGIDHSRYHYMSDHTREQLLSFYAQGNADLAKKYFARPDGRLFLRAWPECL